MATWVLKQNVFNILFARTFCLQNVLVKRQNPHLCARPRPSAAHWWRVAWACW